MTARKLISKLHLTLAAPLCALAFAVSLGGHAALAQTSTMAPTSMAPTMNMAPSTMSTTTKKAGLKSRLPAADKFKSAAEAQASCPADTVVWVNLSGKVYHASGSKYFGKTKHGAYACAKAAKNAGFKASKS